MELALTEEQLKASIADDTTISIGADIYITGAVDIQNVISLLIEGRGFKIDGQRKVACFYIGSARNITLNNLTIANGFTVIKSIQLYCEN